MIAKKVEENTETAWWVVQIPCETVGVTNDFEKATDALVASFREDNPGVEDDRIKIDLRDGDWCILLDGFLPIRDYVMVRTELL